jgi:transcriptional regulator with XRE-family HTH domain
VLKAEGRPLSYQGALAKLETDASGQPLVGGELGAGRLAEGLRRLRRERKLSQKQLAELADVTPSAISQAETARRNLSLETLLTLCARLPVSMDELLGTVATTRRLLARREGRPVDAHTTALCDSASLRTSIYRVQLPPREAGVPFLAHKGTETILVARGLVLVDLGDDTPVLRSGDALVVARDPVKGWTNLTNEVAELFWILDPPELAAAPAD